MKFKSLNLFIYASIAVITISPLSALSKREAYQKKNGFVNTSNPNYSFIASSLSKSFDLYYRSCSGKSSVRPLSKECLNTNGFPSSLIESVEGLFLLEKMEEFRKARALIENTFHCHKVGWIHRRDLWNRLIGSLISINGLTNSKEFLTKAEECAKLALSIDDRSKGAYSMLNLNQMTSKSIIKSETMIESDVGAGLLELGALFKLTGDNLYLKVIDGRILSLNATNGKNVVHVINKKAFTTRKIEYLADIARMLCVIEHKEAEHYIESNIEDISALIREDDRLSESFTYLKAARQDLKFLDKLIPKGCKRKGDHGRSFEMSSIRPCILSQEHNKAELLQDIVRTLKSSSLGNGFSSHERLSNGTVFFNDIQHSSLFGEVFSAAGWLLTSIHPPVVFNEAGHAVF